MPVRRTLAIAAVSVILAGCTSGATSAAPATQVAGSAAGGAVTIGSTGTTLGTILTGANSMTLYVHAGDSATSSTCTGGCATAWPPLTVAAGTQPTAGSGVTGQLATLIRADGATQVTYGGMPLYYWQGDTKAGDTTGQGVNGFTVALAAGTAPLPSATRKPGY
jgi:predicted lipoprotein with Yx(FWY)xxD motif